MKKRKKISAEGLKNIREAQRKRRWLETEKKMFKFLPPFPSGLANVGYSTDGTLLPRKGYSTTAHADNVNAIFDGFQTASVLDGPTLKGFKNTKLKLPKQKVKSVFAFLWRWPLKVLGWGRDA